MVDHEAIPMLSVTNFVYSLFEGQRGVLAGATSYHVNLVSIWTFYCPRSELLSYMIDLKDIFIARKIVVLILHWAKCTVTSVQR